MQLSAVTSLVLALVVSTAALQTRDDSAIRARDLRGSGVDTNVFARQPSSRSHSLRARDEDSVPLGLEHKEKIKHRKGRGSRAQKKFGHRGKRSLKGRAGPMRKPPTRRGNVLSKPAKEKSGAIDPAKVAKLKAKIADGTFKVDSEKISKGLLKPK